MHKVDFQHLKVYNNLMKQETVELKTTDANGKEQTQLLPGFVEVDIRHSLSDGIYKSARDIAYMSLAMKIYRSQGEVELTDEEFKLLQKQCSQMPLNIQDALGLLPDLRK